MTSPRHTFRPRTADAHWTMLGATAALALALAGPAPWAPLAVAFGAIALGLGLRVGLGVLLRPLLVASLAGASAALLRLWLDGCAARGNAGAVALRLFSRSAGGMEVFTVLSCVTPPASFVRALRAMGWPAPLVDVIALAARYVSVFGPAARTAREAQVMRHGYAGFRRGLTSLGALAGLTIVRAFDQAHATSEAMAARGCEGGLHPGAGAGGPAS